MTRDELVLANLSLARRAAHDFQRKRFCCIGDGDDYFQAAVAGMILAADTYDPTVGEFSTWAYFKMRREMQRVFADVEPVLSDPEKAAKRLLKHFSGDSLRSLIRELSDAAARQSHEPMGDWNGLT